MVQAAQGSGIDLCHENEKDIYGDTAKRCLEIHREVPELKVEEFRYPDADTAFDVA